MTLGASDRAMLFDSLATEQALAPGAAVASDVAEHYDRVMARLLACGDPAVVAMALARVDDPTLVRRAEPPHDAIDGGYGKSFPPVTVADKAHFLLKRLLGEHAARRLAASGPAAWAAEAGQWRWDATASRFSRAKK